MTIGMRERIRDARARRIEALQMRQAGSKWREISEHLGVSIERARQLARREERDRQVLPSILDGLSGTIQRWIIRACDGVPESRKAAAEKLTYQEMRHGYSSYRGYPNNLGATSINQIREWLRVDGVDLPDPPEKLAEHRAERLASGKQSQTQKAINRLLSLGYKITPPE